MLRHNLTFSQTISPSLLFSLPTCFTPLNPTPHTPQSRWATSPNSSRFLPPWSLHMLSFGAVSDGLLGRKWLATPVFFSGKSHGQRSLTGYSSWSRGRVRQNLVTKTTRFTYSFIIQLSIWQTNKHLFIHSTHSTKKCLLSFLCAGT